MRRGGDQPLAARTASVGGGHIGLRPGLVEEDQAAGSKPAYDAPPDRLERHIALLKISAEPRALAIPADAKLLSLPRPGAPTVRQLSCCK